MLKIENPVKRVITEIIDLLLFTFLWPSLLLRKEKPPSEIKKILLIRTDHIGDVIMSTGVYREIKKKFPDCRLTVMIGPWGKEILENNPYIDSLIIHNCPWWDKIKGNRVNYLKWFVEFLPETVRKIRKENYDIGIDLRGDFRHILFFLFFGNVKYKISYNRSGGAYLLDKAVEYEIDSHEIEKNFRLLEELEIRNLKFSDKKPEIFITERDREKIKDFFEKNNVKDEKIKLVVHPGGGNKLRMWGEENFASFLKNIIQKYEIINVFLIGNNKEFELCENVKKLSGGLSNVYNLAGRLSIKETAALIERSDIFVGNDSSMGHLASCFAIPSIILFGPTIPERCKPYNINLYYIYHRFPCSPCLQKKCILTEGSESKCMESIAAEEVIYLFEEVVVKYYKRHNEGL